MKAVKSFKSILTILSFLYFGLNLSHAQVVLSDFTIEKIDHQSDNLGELIASKEYTLITFWATWCKPCKRELEALNDIQEALENKNIHLIALSIDDTRSVSKVKPTVLSNEWYFDVYFDKNKQLFQKFNFTYIPSLVLLDKSGKILYQHSQYSPGDEYKILEYVP